MNEEIVLETSSESVEEIYLSKSELEKKLANKDNDLSTIYPTKIKSDVWCMFRIAVYKGVKQHFVTCIQCNAVLAYKSKTGNASLLRHKCYNKPDNLVLKQYLDSTKMDLAGLKKIKTVKPEIIHVDSTVNEVAADEGNVFIKIEPDLYIDNDLPEYTIEDEGLSTNERLQLEMNPANFLQNIYFRPTEENQLSKSEIELKLQSHDLELTTRGPDKSRNSLWKKFKIVYYKEVKQGYAICNECKTILSYKKKTGCASLLRHKCNKRKLYENKDVFVLQSIQPSSSKMSLNPSQPKISNEQITTIGRSQAYFVYKDLRPIDMFDDEKYRSLMQTMISIGANYGMQNVNTIISHGSNVRNIISNMALELKESIKPKISDNKLAITFDIWSNGNVRFLTVFCYFISDSIELKKYYLGTRTMYKSTSLEINNLVINILSEYVNDPVDVINNSILVIGKGQSIISYAFKDSTKTLCCCEMISNIIERALDAKHEKLVSVFHAIETLQKCNAITMPAEDSLSNKFEVKIALLDYFCLHFIELEKQFPEHLSDYVIKNIEIEDIKLLIKLVHPFQQCLGSLSTDQNTKLNEVYLWKKKLVKHCQICEEDTTFIKFFKTELLQLLSDEMIIEDLHKVAVFLDPNFKNLKFLTEDERLEVIEIVKKLLDKHSKKEEAAGNEPLQKKQKTQINNVFLEFMDCSDIGSEESLQLDIKGYMDFRLSEPTTVLKFWKNDAVSSSLKLLVRSVLNIPACSASAKYKFSKEGKSFRENRILIKSNDIDNVLFMHYNN